MKEIYISVVKRLAELPKLIKDKQSENLKIDREINDKDYWKKKQENAIKSEIFSETLENGKKAFTNETLRNDEFLTRSEKNTEYQETLKEFNLSQEVKKALEVELNCLYNEFSAIKYTIRVYELMADLDSNGTRGRS